MASTHIQRALHGLQQSLSDCEGIAEGKVQGPLAIQAMKKSVHDLRSLRNSCHLEDEGLCDWLDEAGVRLWNDSVTLSATDSCGSPLQAWLKWAAFSFIDAGTLAVVDSAHAGQLVIVGSMAAQAVIDSNEATLGQEVLERVAEIASHQEDQPDMAPYWCGRVALALAQQADDLAQYLVSKALEAHCDRKTLAWLVVRRVKRLLNHSPSKMDAALSWLREPWLVEVFEADAVTQLAFKKLQRQASPKDLADPRVPEPPPLASQHTVLLDRLRTAIRSGWSSLSPLEHDRIVTDLERVVSTSSELQLGFMLAEVCRLKHSKPVVGLLINEVLGHKRIRNAAVVPALLWFLSRSDANDVSHISKLLRSFEGLGCLFSATEAVGLVCLARRRLLNMCPEQSLAQAVLWRLADASLGMGKGRIADAQELLALGCLGNAFAASAEESLKAFRRKAALLHVARNDLVAARNACAEVAHDAPSAYIAFRHASAAGQIPEARDTLQRLLECHNFEIDLLWRALSHIKDLAASETQIAFFSVLCQVSMDCANQQQDSKALTLRILVVSVFQLGRLAEAMSEGHCQSLVVETICKVLDLGWREGSPLTEETTLADVGLMASVVCKAALSMSLTQAESLLASLDQFLRCRPKSSSSLLPTQFKTWRIIQIIQLDTMDDDRQPVDPLSLIKADSKGHCCEELEESVVLCMRLLHSQKKWKILQTSLQANAGDIFSDALLRHITSLLMLQDRVPPKQQIVLGRALLQLFINRRDVDKDRLSRWFHFLIQMAMRGGQSTAALELAQDLSRALGQLGSEMPKDELQWLLTLSWESATAACDCADDGASDAWMAVCNRLQDIVSWEVPTLQA